MKCPHLTNDTCSTCKDLEEAVELLKRWRWMVGPRASLKGTTDRFLKRVTVGS